MLEEIVCLGERDGREVLWSSSQYFLQVDVSD